MEVNRLAKIIIAVTTISAAVMELIDTSIVNVALNQMAGNLGASIEDVSWVITSYAIANVIVIPMTSFFSEYFGRKNYYMSSIALFTVASVFCGLSSNIWQLVFWRFVQGLGGGCLLSTSQSILFDAFPKKQRGMAGALFGMGVVMGPTLGPTIGGYIIDNYSWPLIFNINVPFGIVASLLAYRFVHDESERVQKAAIDWYGILFLTVGIASLQYVLERGEADDWFAAVSIRWMTLAAISGLATFVWWELRHRNPVVNLHILKNRNVSLTTMLTFVNGFALFTSVFIFPLLLQRVLGYTAFETGITLLPSTILSLLIMPIVGKKLQSGTSPIVFIAIGFVVLMSFGLLMSRADFNVSSHFFLLPLLLRGAGLALLMVPLTTLAVQGLSPKEMPQGIALNNMLRQLGGSFGIAIINNYVAQNYVVHRTQLVSYLYNGNPHLTERSTAVMQALKAKLPVTANVQQQFYKIMDLSVMKQAYMLTYLDAFRFSALCILVVIPLLLFARNKKMSAEAARAASEAAH